MTRRWGVLAAVLALFSLVVGPAVAADTVAGTAEVTVVVDGRTYTGTLTELVSPSPSPTATPTPTPTATPTPTPTPTATPGDSTPGWLSGASSAQAADGSFGTWRGSKVEIGADWIDNAAVYPLRPGARWNWNGPVDIGVAPPTSAWGGWAAEANGVNDTFWRATFKEMARLRSGKSAPVYVRPYYEFNGDWMYYSVRNSTDAANFIRQWRKLKAMFDAEYPQGQLVLSYADTDRGQNAAMFPGAEHIDVIGVDSYNFWPHCVDLACFDAKQARPFAGMEAIRKLAEGWGLPVAVSEWANQGEPRVAPEGGGESPAYMTAMFDWFRTNAGSGPGKVLYEANFNLWSNFFTFDGQPSRLQPQTAARYAQLW